MEPLDLIDQFELVWLRKRQSISGEECFLLLKGGDGSIELLSAALLYG